MRYVQLLPCVNQLLETWDQNLAFSAAFLAELEGEDSVHQGKQIHAEYEIHVCTLTEMRNAEVTRNTGWIVLLLPLEQVTSRGLQGQLQGNVGRMLKRAG